jgi:hypothetical protein
MVEYDLVQRSFLADKIIYAFTDIKDDDYNNNK